MLIGGEDLHGATAGEERVHVGNDDVADGLFRAADLAQVLDVSRVVVGFDFLPGKELPADDDCSLDLHTVGRTGQNRGARERRLAARREPQPARCENQVPAERQTEEQTPAHSGIYDELTA